MIAGANPPNGAGWLAAGGSQGQGGITLKNRGITLVELVVVIGIVAILAAIALPNYQDSVRKGRRAEAQTALLGFAGRAEQIFTEFGNYDEDEMDDALAAFAPNTQFYTFTMAAADTSFTITATPTNSQDEDRCGIMILDQTGKRSRSQSSEEGSSESEDDCWGQNTEPEE